MIISLIIIISCWLFLWPYIRNYIAERLIPWVRGKFNDEIANNIAVLIDFIDKIVTVARRNLKAGFEFFKTRILRMQSKYTKTSPTTAIKETETYLHTSDGKILKRTETEEVAWEDLPSEIRSEMIRMAAKEGTIDEKAAILTKAKERAAEEGIELEMAS